MRVLITGITGFVGSHLAEYALKAGAEVSGSIGWRSKTENIEHLRAQIRLIESDLRDLSSVQGLLESADPDYIVHLAAQSFVAASWQTPAETLYQPAPASFPLCGEQGRAGPDGVPVLEELRPSHRPLPRLQPRGGRVEEMCS